MMVVLLGTAAIAAARDVFLAERGQARCVIVAPTGWAEDLVLTPGLPAQAVSILQARRRLYRDSVTDLARYLGKMSGVRVDIVESVPAKDRRVPIYVGAAAERVFGPVGISKAGLYGFRVVADTRRGLGLYGESEVGTSYAIYELLHRLGCRWFMPTELGEVVPVLPTLTVPVMDEKLAPATESRARYSGGEEFQRRNRLGQYGNTIWLAMGDGSLQRFFTQQDLAVHPEWLHEGYLRLTHPGVAEHVANRILAELDVVYQPMARCGFRPGYSITPSDGQVPTEDPLARAHDPEPRVWEPAAGRWSVTDRCMVLHNRIAERVRAKYPNVALGDYIYVNKSMPPARYAVPADFLALLAPIDFNRHHPMDWPNHPNEYWLRDMVQGWHAKGARIGFRGYGINLAELSAPCPFITKWGTDIRILLDNNLVDWRAEYMNGWESMLPGYYLSIRMTFHAQEQPEAILDDLWTKFYGAAADPMARYWMGIDRAYLEARAYAGSPFGYLKIFTPEVMAAARANLDEALAACRTPMEYRRVLLIDESFTLFEWYMKMRTDWANGKLADLDADYATWRQGIRQMQRKYGVIDRFAREGYAGDGYIQGRHGNPDWSDRFVGQGYRDGARMEREHVRVGTPMADWKWKHNPGPEADSLPWTKPEYDDKDWPKTHIMRDTWADIGHHLTMTDTASGRSGRMVYRAAQKLPAVPAGKKVYLWIGSTDGSAKVYVNGKLMPYSADRETFSGYCQPAQFDITAAMKIGDNQITILCERTHLNELGTGGLMGPVALYREK
ncbi:MAG: DUF4838 domain-containing protein [Armatimonadota bacterium]